MTTKRVDIFNMNILCAVIGSDDMNKFTKT